MQITLDYKELVTNDVSHYGKMGSSLTVDRVDDCWLQSIHFVGSDVASPPDELDVCELHVAVVCDGIKEDHSVNAAFFEAAVQIGVSSRAHGDG